MKTTLSTVACLFALPALTLCTNLPALAQDSTNAMSGSGDMSKDTSSMDKMFVKKAAMGGEFEVETGKIAQDKGSGQDVKDFGAKMVEDHGKANDELKGIVTGMGMEAPSMALDSKHQKMVDSLNAKSGMAFDKAYLADMTKAHSMDDALFMKESKSGTNQQIKDFAGKTDQVIKQHIQMLDDVKSKMMAK